MTRDEWKLFVGLIMTFWPHQELPAETAELWYQQRGQHWSALLAGQAVANLSETDEHMPTLARLVEAKHAVDRAEAARQGLPAPDDGYEVADPETAARWQALIAAMTTRSSNDPLRQAIHERLSVPLAEARGLARPGGLPYGWDWQKVSGFLGSDYASRTLDELSGLLAAHPEPATDPPPTPTARHDVGREVPTSDQAEAPARPDREPEAIGDVLAQWGAEL